MAEFSAEGHRPLFEGPLVRSWTSNLKRHVPYSTPSRFRNIPEAGSTKCHVDAIGFLCTLILASQRQTPWH